MTELFQTQRIGQSLLRKGLLGKHGGGALRTLLALWWVQQEELLDLA